jgi:hypothetical protein
MKAGKRSLNTRFRNILALEMSDPRTTIQAHILQYITTPVQQCKYQSDDPYRQVLEKSHVAKLSSPS